MELQTLGSDHTFPKAFGVLSPSSTSELLYHLWLLRYPNLKVQKTQFFAICEVKLHRILIFFLQVHYGI